MQEFKIIKHFNSVKFKRDLPSGVYREGSGTKCFYRIELLWSNNKFFSGMSDFVRFSFDRHSQSIHRAKFARLLKIPGYVKSGSDLIDNPLLMTQFILLKSQLYLLQKMVISILEHALMFNSIPVKSFPLLCWIKLPGSQTLWPDFLRIKENTVFKIDFSDESSGDD